MNVEQSTGPGAPMHPAPPDGWRPTSGFAITAFVMSLVVVLPMILGLWWVGIVPLVFAVLALRATATGRFRGRGFAIAALAITLPVGLLTALSHQHLRADVKEVAAGILASLRAGDDAQLERWLDKEAVTAGAVAKIRERYGAVAKEVGEYDGSVEVGSPWTGLLKGMIGPPGAVEIAPPKVSAGESNAIGAGQAYWTEARFEKARLYVALVFPARIRNSPLEGARMNADNPLVIVGDVRFFRPAK